jgi:signal transduction histidine kinase
MLHQFIVTHRDELIARTRAKVSARPSPIATESEIVHGVPLFLTQLAAVLRTEIASGEGGPPAARATEAISVNRMIGNSASEHGGELLSRGFTVAQVVHDYGDICQAVTELAVERGELISAEEFHTLNRCLDDAIASAVTEYGRRSGERHTEHQGFLAHELRNRLNTAMLSLEVIAAGRVGVSGSTMEVHRRSLLAIRVLVDRSLAEVRLASGTQDKEPLRVAELLEEIEIAGQLDAKGRGVRLAIGPVDYNLFVEADRQLLSSAISNLLQNALKYTFASGHVWVRVHAHDAQVSIEIEDECGGLPKGGATGLFRPFDRRGADKTGLGLGLAISREAVRATGGDITVLDRPGRGCVFTLTLPLTAPEAQLRH